MKHGYYLYVDNLRGNSLTNKIRMQIKAFNETISVKECVLKSIEKPVLLRLFSILPFGSYDRDYDSAFNSLDDPDFLYIRMFFPDINFFAFLEKIKNEFTSCKIIVEIPTYPYRREWCSNPYGVCMYAKEFFVKKNYRRLIDRFVTYSYDEVINGVKTIQTMNGVDVESFSAISPDREYDPRCINLVAVAFLMRHHGYERLISGLREYYRKERERIVNIIIVGDGKEKKKYERLIRKYKLSEHVKILDPMYGEDLNHIYDNADAGLSGFGFYKDGVSQVGTLKSREYLAKGLPVILGTEDRLFANHGYEYGLLFPNNASPIDFNRITLFLDKLYLNRDRIEVVRLIRQFAKETVDNRVTLAPVIDYIVNGDL